MSLFRKRKKKSAVVHGSPGPSTPIQQGRRGSTTESVMSEVSVAPSVGSMMKAHWKMALSAQGGTWNSHATLLLGRDLLVLGAQQATVENTEPVTQLYICDTASMAWSTAELKGKGPGYSGFYAATTNQFNADRLFVLWPCPQRGKVARITHSFEAKKTGELTVEEGKLFVVLDETDPIWIGGATTEGGMGVVPRSCLSFDNVPVQQTTRLELSVLNFTTGLQWSSMFCDGELPKCRKYFSYNSIGGNRIFLFGGLSDFNEPTNMVYVLDTEKYHWRRCSSKIAIPPKPRYGHTSTAVLDDSLLLIFGGTDGEQYFNDLMLFNTETYSWQAIKVKGRAPEPRAFHSMTRIDDTQWVVLFGGRNAVSALLSDVHLFNVATNTWHRVLMVGDLPTPRFDHFAGCHANTVIYFGGRDGSTNFFDIYTLDFEGLQNLDTQQQRLDIEMIENLSSQSSPRASQSTFASPSASQGTLESLRTVQNTNRSSPTKSLVDDPISLPPPSLIDSTDETAIMNTADNQSTQAPTHHLDLKADTPQQEEQDQQEHHQDYHSEQDLQLLNYEPTIVAAHDDEEDEEEEEEEIVKLMSRGKSSESVLSEHRPPPSLARASSNLHSTSFRDLMRAASPAPSLHSSSPRSTASGRLTHSPRPNTPVRNRSTSPGGAVSASNTLEEKYSVERTFGDVSNMVERSGNKLNLLKAMHLADAQKPKDEGLVTMELSVSFDDHVFGKPSIGTDEALDIASFAIENTNLFDTLHHHINGANLNKIFRLMRFSKIFDNRVTWFEIPRIISRCLDVEESVLNGFEELDKSQFRKFLVEVAKLKYSKLARESAVLALQHLLEIDIKPHYLECDQHDQELDSLFHINVIGVFSSYRKQLRDLFIMYSALGALSSLVPTWKEVVSKGSTISVAEIMTFTDTFEITPHMVPRHIMSQRIIPLAGLSNEDLELNFTEFLEALGRIALFVYTKYPYSELMSDDDDRVEALFDAIGFNDRKKFIMYIKKIGIGAQNKVSSTRTTAQSGRYTSSDVHDSDAQSIDERRQAHEELLKDKDRLKDELQRIFMYYCSFGDHLNLDHMSSSKFQKFIRDLKIRPPLKPEEADLIFVRLMKNKSQKDGLEDCRLQKMSFPYFIESIKTVASKVHPDLVPTKALVRFLIDNVLPNASKMPEKFTNIDLRDDKVQELLASHRRLLRAIFFIYSASNSPERPSNDYMRVEDFVRLMSELEIIPAIISKKDVYVVFRSTLVDSAYIDITFDQFEECLVKCGAVAYDRHPYNIKFFELHLKVNALLENLGIPDWAKIRKKLVKLGHNIPAKPELLVQKYGGGTESAKDYNFYDRDHLPPEQELDQALRDIFTFYNEYGDKSGRRNLTRQQYIKMVRDSNLVDNHFREIDADLVYMEATKNNQLAMVHETFCDSLALLAQRKYPHMSITDSLHDLLLHHILPYAQRKDSRGRGQDIDIDPALVQEVLKWEQPLRKIFSSYSRLEAMSATAGPNREFSGENMTLSELLKMCQDFDICPALLSVSEINDIFAVSSQGDSVDEDETQLSFDEFIEVVVRMAEKAYSSSHMVTVYKSPIERINALLDRMDLGSAVRLAERLRRLRNFARK